MKGNFHVRFYEEGIRMSITIFRIPLLFKKIFGVEENKDLLISLINSIVSKEDQVSDVILLNPYNPQNFTRVINYLY